MSNTFEQFASTSVEASRARAILEKKVQTGAASAMGLFERVMTQAPKDAIAKVEALRYHGREGGLVVEGLGDEVQGIHRHALQQIAGRADVPGAYLNELASGKPWQAELAAEVLNRSFYHGHKGERALVRSVTGHDSKGVESKGSAPGIVSRGEDGVRYPRWKKPAEVRILTRSRDDSGGGHRRKRGAMSTRSKTRKKAREWMQKELEERKVIAARARREGQEDMRRDGRTLFPSKQKTYNNAEGGIDVSSVIETFPSPYGGVPNFRVPFPMVLGQRDSFRYGMAMRSEREAFLEFRPVEHAFKKRIGDSSVELRWFAWEPNHGNKELEEHTSALFHGMGKLNYVQRTIDMISGHWIGGSARCGNCGEHSPQHPHYGELQRAKELLGECVDELRLRLGKLAPKENLSEREEDYRFGHRMDFAGRRL